MVNVAEASSRASLQLPDLGVGEFVRRMGIRLPHLRSEEDSSDFRALRFPGSEFARRPDCTYTGYRIFIRWRYDLAIISVI